ncbi:CDP-diacylglycerol--glycerol-3-phosphate 3-phosphatidyltransferase [Alloscardovia macacae]|uniref:Phosphatidylinositol phosphate synthase n=1 Tax=Alloscardovia macacae TaxID=1160091 RepID=A0A1Y2SW25_9BIFI|nr:CDP-alcohol phosphatidyltransferase family protein [Alloscardovia macacae]OTA27517.1 CDP-diacylglycerol--glycerol-3-phosphate 3-phosphatidyltransferase [Alloscardovia macacae]OTA30165.1 CDP-diacylglycerol--glycerol-3-phosphate 3-phosphatidyltransferase [Alloscardovia macacae]
MLEKIRGPFKRALDPLARLLVRLGVSANVITFTGAILTSVVALATGVTGWLFAGVLVMTALVLCDALDGSVAALTTGPTVFGGFLDSTMDRMADWAILTGVGLFYLLHTDMSSVVSQVGLAATTVAMMTSFVTPYARARAEAAGFEAKNGIASRSDRILITFVGMGITGLGLPVLTLSVFMVLLAILGLITVYQRMRTVYVQSVEEELTSDKA